MGKYNGSKVYLNEEYLRMTMNFRNNFARLAMHLFKKGRKDKAIKV